MVAEYRVSWHIEVNAESAEEAAQMALDIQRDPTSTATVFETVREGSVLKRRIDLARFPPDGAE